MEKELTTSQIIKKLIGPISPTAESNEDSNRYNNLIFMCELVDVLVMEINDIHLRNKHDKHGSVKKISDYAGNYIAGLKDTL